MVEDLAVHGKLTHTEIVAAVRNKRNDDASSHENETRLNYYRYQFQWLHKHCMHYIQDLKWTPECK